MMAEWKSIQGYPSYFVSDRGEVISTVRLVYSKRKKRVVPYQRIQKLKPTVVNGYCCVSIGCKSENNRKTVKVHRLVAEAFCEKRDGCDQVNHIDGDKANNCAWNLEWCTGSENQKHAYSTGLSTSTERRRAAFKKNRKDNSVPICVLTPEGNVEQFPSMQALANRIGIDRACISTAYKNKRAVRGYVFVYFDKENPRVEIILSSYHGVTLG